jgi:acetyltransferase-like isoleucine patch superfamily enzyme
MIHPSAIISPLAQLGSNVEVGPFTVIHDHVQIGDNSVIGSHCEIGHPSALAEGQPLVIGEAALIRSHSIFYQGSTFGGRLVTGHRVTVREKTVAGENFQIGTLSDIQGHCQIGDYVRFHSNVHIGQKSEIGNFVWIFPYVVLTNDPHPPSSVLQGARIGDFAAIATMSIILPGVTVGEGALVGAHSSVNRNVEPHTVAAGAPAKFVCNASAIKLKDGSGRAAYPWRDHFTRGYPEHIVAQWLQEAQAR